MRRTDNIFNQIDWTTVILFFGLAILGWMNIYAAAYDDSATGSIFDFSLNANAGKQLVWILLSVAIIGVIMAIDFKFYDSFAYILYGAVLLLLIFVILFGRKVSGATSWFELGPIKFQPSEFAKFATSLTLAKFISDSNLKINNIKNQLVLFSIIGLPMALIVLQGDAGTALVFSVMILVLFREGLNPIYLILGSSAAIIFVLTLLIPDIYHIPGLIGLTALLVVLNRKKIKRILSIIAGAVVIGGLMFSVNYIITEVLKPHQQNRIKAFINPAADPLGAGYNVTQSKIAIGSGGLIGKGYLKGTQTKGDFVPEQVTDFIFCTIGEEHGWVGSIVVIGLFVTLLLRIVFIAERQKWKFARVYGYSVACILFFHFSVNIGMTIGLFPVIGIPLPFFSYGGSSLWSFTILLFILLKLDSHRMQVLVR